MCEKIVFFHTFLVKIEKKILKYSIFLASTETFEVKKLKKQKKIIIFKIIVYQLFIFHFYHIKL